jgi:hypothetical protein
MQQLVWADLSHSVLGITILARPFYAMEQYATLAKK